MLLIIRFLRTKHLTNIHIEIRYEILTQAFCDIGQLICAVSSTTKNKCNLNANNTNINTKAIWH